jgi:hypothetical protein
LQPGNVIYAVDHDGRLLRYVDGSQTGGGDVSAPQVVGRGGWQQFGFLFKGSGPVIYAAERALNPAHNYEINGNLNVRIERCFDKKLAVYQATVALDGVKDQLRKLRTQYAQATTAERAEIQMEIDEVLEQIQVLETQLADAKAAYELCLDRFGGVLDHIEYGGVLTH